MHTQHVGLEHVIGEPVGDRPGADGISGAAALMHARTVRFKLGPGQGYILHNGRWLHGRTGFGGRRQMYRILGEPQPADRLGPSVGFGFVPTRFPRSSPIAGLNASGSEQGQLKHLSTGAEHKPVPS